MSFISDVGNFVGSGKAEQLFTQVGTVVNDTAKVLTTIKGTQPKTAQTVIDARNQENAVSRALDEFESGYIKGRYGNLILFAGIALAAVVVYKAVKG